MPGDALSLQKLIEQDSEEHIGGICRRLIRPYELRLSHRHLKTVTIKHLERKQFVESRRHD